MLPTAPPLHLGQLTFKPELDGGSNSSQILGPSLSHFVLGLQISDTNPNLASHSSFVPERIRRLQSYLG